MKPLRFFVPIAACLFFVAPFARGTLLVYEGFSGYSAGLLNGQTPVNTVGISNAAITGGGTTTVNSYDPAGLNFSDLKISGGGGKFSSANSGTTNAQSYIGYTYSGSAVTGTLYSAYLTKIELAQNAGSIVSLRANTTSSASATTSYFVSLADTSTTTNGGNQYDASAGTTTGGATLVPGTTYAIIGRFKNVGVTLSASQIGEGTTFILTEAQFDQFKSNGFTDAELDGAVIGSGPSNVFARIKDADVTSGTFNKFAPGCGIQMAIGNAGATVPQTVSYDEIRYGTSLDDVLPLIGAPEPPPALVSLTAIETTASEPTSSAASIGKFSLNRLDSTTQSIVVNLTFSGTAANGIDYYLPTTATLPANVNSIVIELKPTADKLSEPDETAIITAISGSGYTLASPVSATLIIKDGPTATRSQLIENLTVGFPQKIVVFGTSLTAGGAWSTQMKTALELDFPGQITLVNSGGSGENSVWGKANLQAKVIAEKPATVFIEFATNDAVIRTSYANRITPIQARANLNSIIDSIQSALPNCEIILQVMNPVIGDSASYRPDLAACQQNYRDIGKQRGLLVIDHMPAWQAVLASGESTYLSYVSDGLHPGASGYQTFVTPVILRELGAPNHLAANTVILHGTNQRIAEPADPENLSRSTKIIVTRGGNLSAPLTVPLTISGTAINGIDHPQLANSITIPAGSFSATIEMNPAADNAIEGEETFTIALAAGTGFTLATPNKASFVIEDQPYDQWWKQQFTTADWNDPLISGDDADPDGDGVKNLVEYFTGHRPKFADSTDIALRGTETINGNSFLTLTFDRIPKTGLTGVIQTSPDLLIWQSGTSFTSDAILSDNGVLQTLKSRSLTPIADTEKQFIRLKVTRSP